MNHDIVGKGWAFPLQINQRGGLALVDGYEEIGQAIRIILGTAVGERVMRPEFGSRLHELVFAPINEETKALARRYVEDALAMWEPRITLREVKVEEADIHSGAHHASPGVLSIELDYEINSTGDQRSLVYPFYLIPEE